MKKLSLIFSLFILPLIFFTACNNTSGVEAGDKVALIKLSDDLEDIRVQFSSDPNYTYQVKVDVLPSTALDKSLTYESSTRSVFTIDKQGRLTPRGYGKAAVIVRAADGSRVVSRFDVYIVRFITAFDFSNVVNNETMFTGDSLVIKHTVVPEDATITKLNYSYRLPDGVEGSAADVLTVDDKGMIRIKGVGRAIISATTTDGSEVTKDYEVSVAEKIKFTEMDVIDAAISKKEFRTYDMYANVKAEPADASYFGRYRFTSSDKRVATVDETTGLVTAISTGSTMIRVESLDGSYLSTSATFTVTPGVVAIPHDEVGYEWGAWAKSTYSTTYTVKNGITAPSGNPWHSTQNGTGINGDHNIPQWYIIDMKKWTTFYRWAIWRGSGNSQPDMKEAIIYVSAETEDRLPTPTETLAPPAEAVAFADEATWTRVGMIDFVDANSGQMKSADIPESVSTRYIKIVMTTTRPSTTSSPNPPVKMASFRVYDLNAD